MEELELTEFGIVNERIACCKYVYHLRQTPGFCRKFNRNGLNLNSYCNGNLWRGRLTQLRYSSFAQSSNAGPDMKDIAKNPQGVGYSYVEEPVAWEILRMPDSSWTCERQDEVLHAGLYLQSEVLGDAKPNRRNIGVQVQLGEHVDRMLFLAMEDRIEVPPDHTSNSTNEAFQPRASISIILNRNETCQIVEG